VGIVIAGPATGIVAGGSWGLWQAANSLHDLYQARRIRVRIKLPGVDEPAIIRRRHLNDARLVSASDVGTWQLHVAHQRTADVPFLRGTLRSKTSPSFDAGPRELTVLSGDDALRVAGQLMPQLNVSGARAAQVEEAVSLIEEIGDPASLFAAQAVRGHPGPRSRRTPSGGLLISELPTHVRLALEMAAHEETERRALQGELGLLEEAWRDAEEIAAIADDMFLPEGTVDRLEKLREGVEKGSGER
jgi:hypothetical protein